MFGFIRTSLPRPCGDEEEGRWGMEARSGFPLHRHGQARRQKAPRALLHRPLELRGVRRWIAYRGPRRSLQLRVEEPLGSGTHGRRPSHRRR